MRQEQKEKRQRSRPLEMLFSSTTADFENENFEEKPEKLSSLLAGCKYCRVQCVTKSRVQPYQASKNSVGGLKAVAESHQSWRKSKEDTCVTH